ncbi:MAG: hypothetical protein FIA89_05315 [Geobacter sp.]|nr:hypothetical protein [Geobacter sp.]
MTRFLLMACCCGLLLAGCAGRVISNSSIPAGAQVYRHTDFARNLLGTTPLVSSVEAMMPEWRDDSSDTSIILLFKKQGYQDKSLRVREFELPPEISVTLEPR